MSAIAALGVDAGSTTWKAVAVDAGGALVAHHLELAEPDVAAQTIRVLEALRAEHGIAPEVPVGATGYGRKQVTATRVVTEITCHARGAFARIGRAGVLIDVGGQDTKVIRIGPDGVVVDFAMNDKCAAGTGRFLEVILGRLRVPLEEVARHASDEPVPVSSTCTVFAESEVVSLVAQGRDIGGIVQGLHQALASRVAALAGTVPADTGLFMSGGVALNPAMLAALARALGRMPEVVPEPQLVGALGAALTVLPTPA